MNHYSSSTALKLNWFNHVQNCAEAPGTGHYSLLNGDDFAFGRRPDWAAFGQNWNGLPIDSFMADGGTYRQRRYAAFRLVDGCAERLPHQAHYQDRSHNALNGGIERWFAPIALTVTEGVEFRHVLADTVQRITDREGRARDVWFVEAHQFRILADKGVPGLPTPEGVHRDGRDWVLICLIGSHNLRGGITTVSDRTGRVILEHRLAHSGERLLLDDHALQHGTSAIEPLAAGTPAWRDTLVLTFARWNP